MPLSLPFRLLRLLSTLLLVVVVVGCSSGGVAQPGSGRDDLRALVSKTLVTRVDLPLYSHPGHFPPSFFGAVVPIRAGLIAAGNTVEVLAVRETSLWFFPTVWLEVRLVADPLASGAAAPVVSGWILFGSD